LAAFIRLIGLIPLPPTIQLNNILFNRIRAGLQDKNIHKIDVKLALRSIKKLAVSNRKKTDSEFP